MAIASSIISQHLLTSGLAFLTAATVLARFLASLVFGALWSWQGPELALTIFAAGLVAAMSLSLAVFVKRPELVKA
jgi:hypothetical protein